MNQRMLGGCIAAAVLGALGSSAAYASVLATDPMMYATGQPLSTATDNNGGADSAFSNHWSTLSSDFNNNPTLDGTVATTNMVNPVTGVDYTTAGELAGNTSNSDYGIDYRALSAPLPTASGSSIFISALVKNLAPTTGRTADLIFQTSGSSSFTTNGTGTSVATMGIINNGGGEVSDWGFTAAGGANQFGTSPVSSNNSNTTLIVLELDYNGGGGADTAEFFVDPNSSTPQSGYTAKETGLSLPSGAGNGIGYLELYAGSAFYNSTQGTPNFEVSDIVIGNSFSDVVPEPASLGLLAFGGLGLLARRRRAIPACE